MDILTLNWLVSLGAVAMQGAALAGLVVVFMEHEEGTARLARIALPLSAFIAVVGLGMSLVYSEYYGVVPCGFCWLERAFLYPLAFILPLALWRGDRSIAPYGILLSVIGAGISLYHHYLQMGGTGSLPCPASGSGDCAKRIIFEFGYVTFPLIAFSSFALIIVLMLALRRVQARA